MLTSAAWIVGAALLVVSAITVFQHKLLYMPSRATLPAYEAGGLVAWPGGNVGREQAGDPVRGLISVLPEGQATRGTAIVFHGNAGHAGHRQFYVAPFASSGFRTLLAEYPGYGPRSGEPREQVIVDDAVATIEQAYRQFGAPILIVGESLGAAVAAAAAAQTSASIAGLLLITPWDRLESIASHHYPWLPVKWMLRESHDSVEHLRRFDKPVTIVIAENDRVVPPRYGRALAGSLAGCNTLLTIDNAGHNDWPNHVDGAWWRGAINAAMGDSCKP